MEKIVGVLSAEESLVGVLSAQPDMIGVLTAVNTFIPDYTGEYTVTPTDTPIVLDTQGMRMAQPVTINPIPSNYGKISWNGAILTVS